jgi:hypothetical protein
MLKSKHFERRVNVPICLSTTSRNYNYPLQTTHVPHYDICSILSSFPRLFTSVCSFASRMWDLAVRFGFGLRAPTMNKEDMHVEPPHLAGHEVFHDHSAADINTPLRQMSYISSTKSAGRASPKFDDDHPHGCTSQNQNIGSETISIPHMEPHHSGPRSLTFSMGDRPLKPHFENSEAATPKIQLNRVSQQCAHVSRPDSMDLPTPGTSQVDTGPYDADDGLNFSVLLPRSPDVDIQMELLLTPVHAQLKKLKGLTLENFPPYNPRVQAHSHAQVLRSRLRPIGECIIKLVAQVPEETR